jgi:hypothetical protein
MYQSLAAEQARMPINADQIYQAFLHARRQARYPKMRPGSLTANGGSG